MLLHVSNSAYIKEVYSRRLSLLICITNTCLSKQPTAGNSSKTGAVC